MKRNSANHVDVLHGNLLRRSLVVIGGLALSAGIVSFGCRLDMHIQPKYLPDKPTDFFSDGRSERPQVPGTVAREQLHTDELMYNGTINGTAANVFPFPITAQDLARGRERYDIYCSPCHGYDGQGRGMIVLRGFQQPPSYDANKLRNAPVGHFFQVITNGFGNMYSYASRIPPADRWRIAAYIRALQLSENARISDVPVSERNHLRANTTQQNMSAVKGQGQ